VHRGWPTFIPETSGIALNSDPRIRTDPNAVLGTWADAALAFFRERLFSNGDLEPAIVVLRRHGREVGGFVRRRFRDAKHPVNEIFIDPDFLRTAKASEVGKVVCHQLIHAELASQGRDGSRGRHTSAFVHLAREVGLDVKIHDEKIIAESVIAGSPLERAVAALQAKPPIVGAFTRRKPCRKCFLICPECAWKIPAARGARAWCEGRKPDLWHKIVKMAPFIEQNGGVRAQ
jgi:hypothetical protein